MAWAVKILTGPAQSPQARGKVIQNSSCMSARTTDGSPCIAAADVMMMRLICHAQHGAGLLSWYLIYGYSPLASLAVVDTIRSIVTMCTLRMRQITLMLISERIRAKFCRLSEGFSMSVSHQSFTQFALLTASAVQALRPSRMNLECTGMLAMPGASSSATEQQRHLDMLQVHRSTASWRQT